MEETVEQIWQAFTESHKGEFLKKEKQIFTSTFREDNIGFSLLTYRKGINSKSNLRTEFSCILPSQSNFQFKVKHQGIYNSFFMLLGMQDIKIDDQYFDDNFVIQSNDEPLMKQFLNEECIRNFLPKSYELVFQLKNKKLSYTCRGLIKDSSLLDSLYFLIRNSVDHLSTLGVISINNRIDNNSLLYAEE